MVSTVVGVGDGAAQAIEKFCKATQRGGVQVASRPQPGSILLLRPGDREAVLVKARQPKEKQRRHIRKYAEGELAEDRSFSFGGRTTPSISGPRTSARFFSWRPASMTRRGYIIYGVESIRGGFATPSRMKTLPQRPLPLKRMTP